MKIQLAYPASIVVQPPKTITFDEVEFLKLEDNPDTKIALAKMRSGLNDFDLILWQDTDYDAIGDYTQEQVYQRVEQLLNQ